MRRSVAVVVLLLVVIAAGLVVAQRGGGGGAEPATPAAATTQAPPKTYTFAIAPGSVLEYNNTYYTSEGEEASSTSYRLNMTQLQWPLFQALYTVEPGNETGGAQLAPANIALPLELIGADEVQLPLIVPGVGASECVVLGLEGEVAYNTTGTPGTAYLYHGVVEASGYRVKARIAYDSRTGLAVDANYTVYSGDGEVIYSSRQVLTGYTLQAALGVQVPGDWACDPPYSSDVRFVLEGTYRLEAGGLEAVEPLEARDAVLEDGFVAVVSKSGDPLVLEFWRNLVEASRLVPEARVYVVVLGPLSSQEEYVLSQYIAERASSVEPVVLVSFRDGRVAGKVYRYGTLEDMVSLLRGTYHP